MILCPKTTQEEVLRVAERIQKKIRNAVFSTQQRHSVSISIVTLRLDDTPHTLISHADAALYQAKKDGCNTICIAPQLILENKSTHWYRKIYQKKYFFLFFT